jgi:hypothetical protein
LTIDYETADKITIVNLKDAYESMRKDNAVIQQKLTETGQIEEYKKQDMVYNITMMTHISEVLKYFGETV